MLPFTLLRYLFCLLFIIQYLIVIGNDKFIWFTSQNGLSLNHATCITEDRYGFLWIGTEEGLNRFDGVNFEIFRPDLNNLNSISGNEITLLLADSDGVWIALNNNGLCYYQYATENFIRIKKTYSQMTYSCLTKINGKLFVGTSKGLFLVNSNQLITTPITSQVKSISHTKDGTIYVATVDGLWTWTKDGRCQKKIPYKHCYMVRQYNEIVYVCTNSGIYVLKNQEAKLLFDGIEVSNIYRDQNYNFWLGTSAGIVKTTSEIQPISQLYPKHSKLKNTLVVKQIVETQNQKLYFLLEDYNNYNLIYYNSLSNSMEEFASKYLNDNRINYIFEDSRNILWLATQNRGICKIIPEKFDIINRLLDEKDIYSKDNDIYAIANQQDEIWFGTSTGIKIYNPDIDKINIFKSIAINNLATGNVVGSLLYDQNHNLWIGYYNGRWLVYNCKKNEVVKDLTPQNSSETNSWSVRKFLEDDSANIWIGTCWGGLVKYSYRTNNYQLYQYKKSPQLWVNDIIWVNQKLLLATRNNNLLYFDTGKNEFIEICQKTEDLVDYRCLCLIDSSNVLIGSNMGLWTLNLQSNKMTNNELTQFKHNSIQAIMQQPRNVFWITTLHGIIRWDKKTNQIYHFTKDEELIADEYNKSALFSDNSGHIFAGSKSGFSKIKTEININSNLSGKTYITNIYINGIKIKPQEEYDGEVLLTTNILETKHIKLNHLQKNLSFSFINTEFSSPTKLKYIYRLEGYDEIWQSNSSAENLAKYTNLAPGNYVFIIRAYFEGNPKKFAENRLMITILPPWYKTLYFKIIASVFFISLLFFLFYSRTYYLHRRNKILEERIKQRTKQLVQNNIELENKNSEISKIAEELKASNEAKIRFYTNVSHELKTPLTLIISPIEQLVQNVYSNEELLEKLHLIKDNATILYNLINQLLDLRKIESGKETMNRTKFNVVEQTLNAVKHFQEYALTKNIEIKVDFESEIIIIEADAEKISTITTNLLSNAIHYSPENSKIIVFLSTTSTNNVQIRIEDTGFGIEQEFLPYLFDSFNRASEHRKSPKIKSSGIGLSLVKSIVDMHNGIIEVESTVGKGTIFTVIIPICDKHHTSTITYSEYNGLPKTIEEPTFSLSENTKHTILYAEDNQEMAKYIKKEMSSLFTVITKANGLEAWKYIENHYPDIVISDLMMPEMDGISLCKAVKNNNETNHIPVILLTALSDEQAKIEAYNAGADAYITKPFVINTLKHQIQSIFYSRKKLREKYLKLNVPDATVFDANQKDHRFLEKAILNVKENITNLNFNNQQFIELMGLSKTAVYNKLMSLTNQTVSQFIRAIRMKEAAELLQKGEYNVSEASLKVGYKDVAQFSREFKQFFGKLPSEFKRLKI